MADAKISALTAVAASALADADVFVVATSPTTETKKITYAEIKLALQSYSARLADVAGLAATNGNVIVGDGANWVAESGATARTSLGLGTGDSPTFTDLVCSGNMTINGTVTTIDTTNLVVEDPLIKLATNNTSADTLDVGFYGVYDPSGTDLFAGLFRDASDGKFRLFRDLEAEPTTTVNLAGDGYAVATLVADVEGTVTGIANHAIAGLSDVSAKTGTGTTVVFAASPTITTPTISSFANAGHDHQDAAGGAQLDHGAAMAGLGDDDHTIYALLAGRSTGQSITGGTGSGEDLTLASTSHGTKGAIILAAGTSLDVSDEAVKAIKHATFVDEHAAGTKTAGFTIDLNDGQKQAVTVNASGPLAVALTDPPGPGNFVLKIVQGATPGTLSWPASVKWPGGTAPTLSASTGDVDLVSLYHDGANYYGQAALAFD